MNTFSAIHDTICTSNTWSDLTTCWSYTQKVCDSGDHEPQTILYFMQKVRLRKRKLYIYVICNVCGANAAILLLNMFIVHTLLRFCHKIILIFMIIALLLQNLWPELTPYLFRMFSKGKKAESASLFCFLDVWVAVRRKAPYSFHLTKVNY